MKKRHEYRANGKLLLSGEYLVLQGAVGLALPVRYGQQMSVGPLADRVLSWTSAGPHGTWFSCNFSLPRLDILSATDAATAASLQRLLFSASALCPEHLAGPGGYQVTVTADYPLEWGLGSSSTLISLVSQWFGADGHSLYRMVASGSGYDLACAGRNEMFLYQTGDDLPFIETVRPGNALTRYSWFTWLGKKQRSDTEVSAFRSSGMAGQEDVGTISRISRDMATAETPEELISLADEHASILSRILGKPVLKTFFPGLPGTIKSLGAWGGDFAMVVSGEEETRVKQFLTERGHAVIFSFNQLLPAHD